MGKVVSDILYPTATGVQYICVNNKEKNISSLTINMSQFSFSFSFYLFLPLSLSHNPIPLSSMDRLALRFFGWCFKQELILPNSTPDDRPVKFTLYTDSM